MAEPWIDTSNIFLRESIQRLADAGYIKTPVTTYPLMWNDIAKDLKTIRLAKLTENNKNAYHYINHQLKLAKRNQQTIEASAAFNESRFTSFGDTSRYKYGVTVNQTIMTDSFAMKFSPSIVNSSHNDENTRYDGSYLATYLGNWVASIGMQDRWWGPGWDTNLSLTNNARPIPAIALSRKSAVPVNIPFTDINIPWTVTTFMGVMDDNRIVKDTLLWGFRLNFKPIENLEVGITRLAQWGGENRPQDLSTFWDVFIGKDNCGAGGLNCDNNQEPGNQQAGYDLRYSFTVNNTPIALYGQYFAEDGDNSGDTLSFLTEPQIQVGLDTHLQFFDTPTSIFLEYSDTYADCRDSDASAIGNCFYEHHIYQTGMRYEQRTLGNLYDNDAKSIVLGAIVNLTTNTDLQIKLRHLKLNQDNSDKAPNNPIIGNPLTKVAEDMIMLSGKLQHNYKNWRYTVSANISQSDIHNNASKENDANLQLKVEYNL